MAARRRFRWGFVVPAILILVLIVWFVLSHQKPAKTGGPPPVSVTEAKVSRQDVTLSVSELGAAQAWLGVTIHAQVSGILQKVDFAEGADVRAGQVLAEINPAPFRAVLLQAQGALARDQALLQEARVDLARYQKLSAQDSIARQQLDAQAALVKQDEGLVKIDQGAVDAAQVNLDFCRITSPIAGRVGVRLVDPGNLVSASDATGVVVVNQITPIAVTFNVPEGDFERLSQASNGFRTALSVEALSQETGQALGEGELSIADNGVDPSTGTVELKARFENASRQLWPGQFLNVRLRLQTLANAVTVPAAAINQGPHGPFAYVVGANNKVASQPVVVAANQDGMAVIKSGLTPGQTVVTDGQMILKPGLTVAVHAQAAKKPVS